MIASKYDYKYYLEADKIALKINRKRPRFIVDRTWSYTRTLRKVEYLLNCPKKNPVYKIRYKYYRTKLELLILLTKIRIRPNTCGPGISIAHDGTIEVHGNARLGKNCRIHLSINIGAEGGGTEAPQIGDGVYIGPGAVLFGTIEIADHIAIGANAVVNKSFTEPGITIGGVPAKKISDKGSAGHIIPATDILDQKIQSGEIKI